MTNASIARTRIADSAGLLIGTRMMLVLSVVLLFATAAYNTKWLSGISDDYFFYQTAFFGADAETVRAMHLEAAQYLDELGLPSYEVSDYAAKNATSANYMTKTLGIYAAKQLFTDFSGEDYGYQVFKAVLGGLLINLALVAAVIFAVFRSIGRRDTSAALLLSVVGLFYCEYVLSSAVLNWRLSEAPVLDEFVLDSLNFFINPSLHFSQFGFTGRNFFVALMFPFFALRWSNHLPASYVFLVSLSLVHQIYAGILLALVIAVDLTVRPWVLRRLVVALSIPAGLVLTALRQGLHHGVGSAGTWAIDGMVVVPAIGVLVLSVILAMTVLRPMILRYYGFTRRLSERNPILPDIVLLGLAAAVIGLVSWYMTQRVGVVAAKLSWSELSGRLLSFLRIGIVFGLVLMALRWLREMPARWAGAVRGAVVVAAFLGGMAALGGVAVRAATQPYEVAANFTNDDVCFEQFLRSGGAEPPPSQVMHRFALLYYVMNRAIDRRDDSFERFIAVLKS